MRKFSSYGQLNTKQHYYAPRTALLERAYTQLVGENQDEGGHYITVWAPRQTGKSSVMQQILSRLQHQQERFDVAKINLQVLKTARHTNEVTAYIADKLNMMLNLSLPKPENLEDFEYLFSRNHLPKPLVLILDEFDALPEDAISNLAAAFRNIYNSRQDQIDTVAEEKDYLLHGVALIGVRSVLGIENQTGSPFNIQRSLHIPNLTYAEVEGMFRWYEQESGQHVEQSVIEHLYAETNGQPGLTCWFGELLTEGFEGYRPSAVIPIGPEQFENVYAAALNALPNNNILNIVSKAKQPPYKDFVLNLFKTDEKVLFKYDNPTINFLYMNGVTDQENPNSMTNAVKFASPFVQKRLFNYFSDELFQYVGKIFTPFENLDDTITDSSLNVRNLMRRYERHLRGNREWLLKDAPRRADLRVYEAVYHFNLYMYLTHFLQGFGGRVYPEFPTGNGKIDLIIRYAGTTYGLEVKSYTTNKEYQESLIQAARYGRQLGLTEIALVIFVESIDDTNRTTYETVYTDEDTGTTVIPIFVETGR